MIRLFHPGDRTTVRHIDGDGFNGRDPHPPTDGSLTGKAVRILKYGETSGMFDDYTTAFRVFKSMLGVDSEPRGGNFQVLVAVVVEGEHRGKVFEFINHELAPKTDERNVKISVCRSCGSRVSTEARYCSDCGAKS